MSFSKEPEVRILTNGGTIWNQSFNTFDATIYCPKTQLDPIINYGFIAPYLLYFVENPAEEEELIRQADRLKLSALAAKYASSVVFIRPVTNDWETASPDIFAEIISNSKIHQYNKCGYTINLSRFFNTTDGYSIRGAIFRTCLIGFGKAANYIATNCIKHFEGDGLWGRSDIAPATCVLTNLSVKPKIEADDIPILDYGNNGKYTALFQEKCKYTFQRGSFNFYEDYELWAKQFRRMTGPLIIDPDLEKLGLRIRPASVIVKTAKDNNGDDKDTENHKIGYVVFYNKELPKTEKWPLVLCFHGGGDSAFYISIMSGWAKIANRHNFLLVSVENHLNSTVTEMMELIEHLKTKYPVDETKIYSTGFSMGGCKTWDFIQEYPKVLAAAAPMDATWDVGLNLYGKPVETPINQNVAVPTFYAGGEATPLPELPCQAQKCLDRMGYALKINKVKTPYNVKLEDKDNWENKIWGINGDITEVFHDDSRDANLTLQMFKNTDDKIFNIFASISEQGHDCREHTCEYAWRYMSNFSRVKGNIIGGDIESVLKSLKDE